MSQIKAIYFEKQDVGRHVRSTKKRYTWKFEISKREYKLELYNSVVSIKKVVKLDGVQVYFDNKITILIRVFGKFNYSFTIGHNMLTLAEIKGDDQFELRINNERFQDLYSGSKYAGEVSHKSIKNKGFSEPYIGYGSQDIENMGGDWGEIKIARKKQAEKMKDRQSSSESISSQENKPKYKKSESNSSDEEQNSEKGKKYDFGSEFKKYSYNDGQKKKRDSDDYQKPTWKKESSVRVQSKVNKKEIENVQQLKNPNKFDDFANFGRNSTQPSAQLQQQNQQNEFKEFGDFNKEPQSQKSQAQQQLNLLDDENEKSEQLNLNNQKQMQFQNDQKIIKNLLGSEPNISGNQNKSNIIFSLYNQPQTQQGTLQSTMQQSSNQQLGQQQQNKDNNYYQNLENQMSSLNLQNYPNQQQFSQQQYYQLQQQNLMNQQQFRGNQPMQQFQPMQQQNFPLQQNQNYNVLQGQQQYQQQQKTTPFDNLM